MRDMFRPSCSVEIAALKEPARVLLDRNCLGLRTVAMRVFGLSIESGRLWYGVKCGSFLCLFCLCISDVAYGFVGLLGFLRFGVAVVNVFAFVGTVPPC
jgi:hypothetical protein